MMDKTATRLGLVIAIFTCVAAYLVIPQVQILFSQTPTPTYTPAPTAPSTSTPQPTIGLDVALVQTAVAATLSAIPPAIPTATVTPSQTPVPTVTDTETPTPQPTPSQTPTTSQPTLTSTLTPTPNLNTPLGTVLAPGEAWVQDGVTIFLKDYEIFAEGIRIRKLRVINNTENPIVFDWNFDDNILVRDNIGNIYSLTGDSFYSHGAVKPGESMNLFVDVKFKGPISQSNVTSIRLTLLNISRIREATWEIPVYH